MNQGGPVARGQYGYLLNGKATDIEESWELFGNAQQRRVRSRRVAAAHGITISVESRQADNLFSYCALRWQDAAGTVAAEYRFAGERATVTRREGGRSSVQELLAEDVIFSPLLRIYTGPVLEALAASGGARRVLVPWIRDPADRSRLLTPHWSERRATALDEDRVTIDGKTHDCRCYDYSGGEYPAGTRFWVDPDGILLRYCWQQDDATRWEVKLQAYRQIAGKD